LTFFYTLKLLIHWKSNQRFISSHRNFPCPPARLSFDAYDTVNWKAYFDSGVVHTKIIADIIEKNIIVKNIRVCEWGCGPARIIWHLRNTFNNYKNVELYGCDYNQESIAWCLNHIDGIKFFVNGLQPPLPFENDFLDCIYARSVVTHLSEAMNFKWIKELSRVVKFNGLIIITTHGDLTTDRLLVNEKEFYDSGKLVVRGNIKEGEKWYLAYHPSQFVKNELLFGFKIIYHARFSNTVQDIWAIRNTIET
jgi:ubiquinone/menaquinone biosynthesis C-methylase UbiE